MENFGTMNPPWRFVVDDVRVERRGEYVVQSAIDRVEETPINQIPHWLLYWQMREPIGYDRGS